MVQVVKLLDTVALLKSIPGQKLRIGQVGTIVEILGEDDFEVEFTDKEGHPIAILPLKRTAFLVLQYEMA